MGGAELYADNTAHAWASLAPWSRVASGAAAEVVVVDIPAQRATRVMLRQLLAIGAAQIGALMRRAGNRPHGSGTMSLALIWCLMAGQ
jgi:hypothetical protein